MGLRTGTIVISEMPVTGSVLFHGHFPPTNETPDSPTLYNVVLWIPYSRILVYAIHHPQFYPTNRRNTLSTPHPALESGGRDCLEASIVLPRSPQAISSLSHFSNISYNNSAHLHTRIHVGDEEVVWPAACFEASREVPIQLRQTVRLFSHS
jgi:hypothetical protein